MLGTPENIEVKLPPQTNSYHRRDGDLEGTVVKKIPKKPKRPQHRNKKFPPSQWQGEDSTQGHYRRGERGSWKW